MKFFIKMMMLCCLLISFSAQAKILQYKNVIKFITTDDVQITETAPRFQSFKKYSALFSHKECSKSLPYSLQGGGVYASLMPFFEWWQRSDFRVFPDKKHAVVFSASCQRPCAAAEIAWKCTLHATALDSNGYVTGDMGMGGDFVDVILDSRQPYIILIRDSCCDAQQYAEVYDLKGTLIRKIDDYRKIKDKDYHVEKH
jgi:hypothetical protein